MSPSPIIEVGGGFSTLIARRALSCFDIDCELVVIDPEPRTDVEVAADRVVRLPVQEAPAAEITADSLLFIDSSHVTRIGGDVPFLYGQLLAAVPAGVLVHVHDVFIPYDYPPAGTRYLWTEQYLLEALLSHAPRYEVRFATHWMSRTHPRLMQELISPAVAADPLHYGASFWFEVV